MIKRLDVCLRFVDIHFYKHIKRHYDNKQQLVKTFGFKHTAILNFNHFRNIMGVKNRQGLAWLLVFLIWIYIIFRASLLSMTHDEAFSFFLMKTNYLKAMAGTANTHWLNSLTMKIGFLISKEPIFIRWGSVASWLLYGFASIRLYNLLEQKAVAVLLLSALLLNPFVIDFFSLARGYAMMCAFSLMALQQAVFVAGKAKPNKSDYKPIFIWAILAVFANFTALYFLMALTGVMMLHLVYKKQYVSLLQWKSLWLPVLITIVFAATNLLFIKFYTGDLEYGGSSFSASIFKSLVEGSVYKKIDEHYIHILTYSFLSIVVMSIAFAFYAFAKGQVMQPVIVIAFVAFSILALTVAFHLLFGTPYLQSRTSLILYPLFVCAICFSIDKTNFVSSKIKMAFSGAGATIIALYFATTLNLTFCYEWKFQADTARCLTRLAKEYPKNVLMHDWHTGILVNYFKSTEPAKYNFSFTRLSTERMLAPDSALLNQLHLFDYAVLAAPVNMNVFSSRQVKFQLLEHFPTTGVAIYKIE